MNMQSPNPFSQQPFSHAPMAPADPSGFAPGFDSDQHGMPAFVTCAPRRKESYWRRIGGGSLFLSLLVHTVFVIIAIFLIKFFAEARKEVAVDFLPGGGGGGKSTSARLQAKRQAVSMSAPTARITSTNAMANVVLPDSPQIISSTSLTSFAMPMAGGMGGGEGGIRGKGRGGLMGDGFGQGTGPGHGKGFVAMFGRMLQARKLGVVLDVSKSMHPYLPTVVHEANRVGTGAPVVMYYGCGITQPSDKSVARQSAQPASGKEFDHFWRRIPNGPKPDKDSKVDASAPMPLEDSYKVVNGRRETYFYEKSGVGNAWLALLSSELRSADAIYWFCDFRDPVDEAQLAEVLKEMQKRRQKLYVHASGKAATTLQQVIDRIVKPTGGEQIMVELKPQAAPKAGAKPNP